MSQQPEKSVAQVLRDAAAIVGKGWCQGRYLGNGGVCLMGAINRATFNSAIGFHPVARKAEAVVVRVLPEVDADRRATTAWNDAPERTQAEVIAKLLEAAELAEREATHV